MFFVLFIDNMGLGLVFNVFAPLILLPEYGMLTPAFSTHMRDFLFGLVMSFFPIAQFFGAPIIGDLGDHFGRKKAFYISIVGVTLGLMITGIAIVLRTYVLLLISRILTGFFAGNFSICMAAIADLSPDEKTRAKNYGWLATISGASWVLAMLIGGYLSNPKFLSPSIPFWVISLFSVASFIMVMKVFKETHPTREKMKIDLLRGMRQIIEATKVLSIRRYYFVYCFWILGWCLALQWFPAFFLQKYKFSTQEISLSFVYVGTMWSLGSGFVNRILIKRFHSRLLMRVGLSAGFFGLFIMSFLYHYPLVLIIIYGASALFSSFGWSNTINMISLMAPESIQGKVMGITQSSQSLGFFIIPFIGGAIAIMNINYVFPVSTFLLAIAGILVFVLPKTIAKQ